MTDAPALTVLGSALAGPRSSAAWRFEGVESLEIAAPDPHCALLLREYAAPAFPVEIVSGSPLLVTFRRPPAGGDWVVEALALVERWLAAIPLPCARIVHEGPAHVVRTPIGALEI